MIKRTSNQKICKTRLISHYNIEFHYLNTQIKIHIQWLTRVHLNFIYNFSHIKI